jgi:hypothetical protein
MIDRARRYIEYKLREADYRLRLLARRYSAVEQGIQRTFAQPQNFCTTTITGTIYGGLESTTPGVPWVPMPNTTLKVVGYTTGNVYGIFDIPTGNYSIDLHLNPSDSSLKLWVLGPSSPRFASTYGATPTITTLVTQCASNAIPYMQPALAPNHFWFQGSAANGGQLYPIYSNGGLPYTDSRLGGGVSSVCRLVDTYAWTFNAATYTAATNVPMFFQYNSNQAHAVYKGTDQFNRQPKTGTCPVTTQWDYVMGASSDISSVTSPAVDYSTTWQVTFACTDDMVHNGSGSIQFYEDPP